MRFLYAFSALLVRFLELFLVLFLVRFLVLFCTLFAHFLCAQGLFAFNKKAYRIFTKIC
jgi:hypothetical protein